MKFQFGLQIFRCLNLVLTVNFDQTVLKSMSRVNFWFVIKRKMGLIEDNISRDKNVFIL